MRGPEADRLRALAAVLGVKPAEALTLALDSYARELRGLTPPGIFDPKPAPKRRRAKPRKPAPLVTCPVCRLSFRSQGMRLHLAACTKTRERQLEAAEAGLLEFPAPEAGEAGEAPCPADG